MGEAKRRSAAGLVLRRLEAPQNPAPLAKFVLPAGAASPAPMVPPETAALAESVRAKVRAALVEASADRSLTKMLQAVEALGHASVAAYEASLAEAARRDQARGRDFAGVACRRGCAFCCHVDVAVTPLEAIRLGSAAPVARPAASARRLPCPLLVDGACSHYEGRPYACRSIFSSDAGLCEAGFASDDVVFVSSLDWPRHLAAGYISGELAALADLRLVSRMVELRRALAAIAADGSAVLRWFNGGEGFLHRAQ